MDDKELTVDEALAAIGVASRDILYSTLSWVVVEFYREIIRVDCINFKTQFSIDLLNGYSTIYQAVKTILIIIYIYIIIFFLRVGVAEIRLDRAATYRYTRTGST